MNLLTIPLALALVATVSGHTLFRRSAEEDNYLLVVDAGSTGSRLKVYSWSPSEDSDNLPDLSLVSNTKYKPGLSDFEDNLEGLAPYMKQIVDKALEVVPESKHSDTPIVVMATAGLRFFSAEASESILNEVASLLTNDSFSPFPSSSADVQVLSGEEEAVYAWVAVNYLRGFFTCGNDSSVVSEGVLELGGGSSQIAFLPDEPMYAGEFQVNINCHSYPIYAQSYLDFGANGIQRRIVDHLLLNQRWTRSPLRNPCMLKDDQKSIQLEDGRVVETVGTGQPIRCSVVLSDILQSATGIECQPKPCAIGTVYQPHVGSAHFEAISAFQHAPKVLGALRDDNSLDLETLLNNAVQSFCRKNINDITDEEGGQEFASNNCINAIYMSILFTDDYGFESNTANIFVNKDIGGQSVDWALGAAVMEVAKTLSSTSTYIMKR